MEKSQIYKCWCCGCELEEDDVWEWDDDDHPYCEGCWEPNPDIEIYYDFEEEPIEYND